MVSSGAFAFGGVTTNNDITNNVPVAVAGALATSGSSVVNKINAGSEVDLEIGGDTYVAPKSRYNPTNVYAPALTATDCQGSQSTGVTVLFAGVTNAETNVYSGCHVINGSIRLADVGLQEASVHVMCYDPVYMLAMEATGYDCGDAKGNSVVTAPKVTRTREISFMSGMHR